MDARRLWPLSIGRYRCLSEQECEGKHRSGVIGGAEDEGGVVKWGLRGLAGALQEVRLQKTAQMWRDSSLWTEGTGRLEKDWSAPTFL